MKILLICHEYPPLGGGGGRQLMNLAGEYSKNHEVYFLTVGFHEFGLCEKNGYTLHRLRASRKRTDKPSNLELLSFVYKTWRILPDVTHVFTPDIVHIFFSVPGGLLIFHPALRKIPSIISVRGADVPGHDPDRFKILYAIFRPIVKMVWRNASKVICNSHDLRKEVLSICPSLKVDVIPTGIDTTRFAPVLTMKKTDELVLLYVGRIIPLKQIDIIIKSVSELKKHIKDKKVIFRIIGTGEQKTALKKLVRQLHLEENVVFAGEVSYDFIHDEYRKADVYIQLSKVEGMSNAILEAMSSGLPVITTNVGGASAFVNNNGFILEEASVRAVVDCVKQYAKNSSLLKIHGERSRQLAEKFSFEKISRQYVDVMSLCLAKYSYLSSRRGN